MFQMRVAETPPPLPTKDNSKPTSPPPPLGSRARTPAELYSTAFTTSKGGNNGSVPDSIVPMKNMMWESSDKIRGIGSRQGSRGGVEKKKKPKSTFRSKKAIPSPTSAGHQQPLPEDPDDHHSSLLPHQQRPPMTPPTALQQHQHEDYDMNQQQRPTSSSIVDEEGLIRDDALSPIHHPSQLHASTLPQLGGMGSGDGTNKVTADDRVRMIHVHGGRRGQTPLGGRRVMTPLNAAHNSSASNQHGGSSGSGAIAPIHTIPGLNSSSAAGVSSWPAPANKSYGSGQGPQHGPGGTSPRGSSASLGLVEASIGGGSKGGALVTDPSALKDLNTFLQRELSLIPANDERAKLVVYKELFDRIVETFTTYAPLLSQVRDAYNRALKEQEEAIQQHLLGDKALQLEKEKYLNMQQECVVTTDRERAATEQHKQRVLEVQQDFTIMDKQHKERIAILEEELEQYQKTSKMEETVRREADENLATYIKLYNELKDKWGKAREEVVEYKKSISGRMTYLETAERCAVEEAAHLRELLAKEKREGAERYNELKNSTVDPKQHKLNMDRIKKLQENIKNQERKIEWMQADATSKAHYESPINWSDMGAEYNKMKSSGKKSSEDIVRIILLRLSRAQKAERLLNTQLASYFTMKEYLNGSDFAHIVATTTKEGHHAGGGKKKSAEGLLHQPFAALKLFLSPLVAELGLPPPLTPFPRRGSGDGDALNASGTNMTPVVAEQPATLGKHLLASPVAAGVKGELPPTKREKIPYLNATNAPWSLDSWRNDTIAKANDCPNMFLGHELCKEICVGTFTAFASHDQHSSITETLDHVCRNFCDFTNKAQFFASLVYACTECYCGDSTIAFIISGLRSLMGRPFRDYARYFLNVNVRLVYNALEKTERCLHPGASIMKSNGTLPRRLVVECLLQLLPHKTPRQIVRLKHALFKMVPLHIGKGVYFRDLFGAFSVGLPSPMLVELCDQFIDEVLYFTSLLCHSVHSEARENAEDGRITPYQAKLAIGDRLPKILVPPRPGSAAHKKAVADEDANLNASGKEGDDATPKKEADNGESMEIKSEDEAGTSQKEAEQQLNESSKADAAGEATPTTDGDGGEAGSKKKHVTMIAEDDEHHGTPAKQSSFATDTRRPSSTPRTSRHAALLQQQQKLQSVSTSVVTTAIPAVLVKLWVNCGVLGTKELDGLGGDYTPHEIVMLPRIPIVEDSTRDPSITTPTGGGGHAMPVAGKSNSIVNLVRRQSTAPGHGGGGGDSSPAANMVGMVQAAGSAMEAAQQAELNKKGKKKLTPEEEAALQEPFVNNANEILEAMFVSNATVAANSTNTDVIAANQGMEVDAFLQNLAQTVALVPMPYALPKIESELKELELSQYDDPPPAAAGATGGANGDDKNGKSDKGGSGKGGGSNMKSPDASTKKQAGKR